MHDVCIRLKEEWDKKGYSLAKMSIESGVSETTLRRVRAAESSISLETAVAVARVVGVSLDELTGLMPPPAVAALDEIRDTVREDLKYIPNGPHCATDCTARKRFDETLDMIRGMYETAAKKDESLYERGLVAQREQLMRKDEEIARKESEIKKIENAAAVNIRRLYWISGILAVLFIVAVAFLLYLIYWDFPQPDRGMLQYMTVEQLLEHLHNAGYVITTP